MPQTSTNHSLTTLFVQMNIIPHMLFVVYWVPWSISGVLTVPNHTESYHPQGLSRAMGQSKLPLGQAMNAWDLGLAFASSKKFVGKLLPCNMVLSKLISCWRQLCLALLTNVGHDGSSFLLFSHQFWGQRDGICSFRAFEGHQSQRRSWGVWFQVTVRRCSQPPPSLLIACLMSPFNVFGCGSHHYIDIL